MKLKLSGLIILLLIIIFIPSCNRKNNEHPGAIIIGISSDIDSYNPLFSYTEDEGNVSSLLYLSLIDFDWNERDGELIPMPMLAKDWQWNKDSTSITFDLRKDVYWSDGVQFTASDVIFSYDLYSDPAIQSSRYGIFRSFAVDTALRIDLKKTFIVENPFKIVVNLKKGILPTYIDFALPVVPEHVFKNIDRKNLITVEKQLKPVTDGPFYLAKWDKNQAIILKENDKSFLHKPGGASELIFKIVPDYTSRITQLKNGEIDFMEDVKAEDLNQLENLSNVKLTQITGREYDYAAWSNIDPDAYQKNKKILPNKFFGDKNIREAMTYAINRQEILHDFIKDHGELAAGPVAPIFKNDLDTLLKTLPYDPEQARKILAGEGWKDVNNSGVLEKNGQKFSFTFYIPSGNPRRVFAASVIKNDLKQIGVDMKIESLEPQVFFQKVFSHQLNAWMAGWSVAIPLDLKSFWFSDLQNTPMNFSCYQNKNVDKLLIEIDHERNQARRRLLFKEVQDIIYSDNPVTFLYWINNNIAYNSRIKDINITTLGAVYHPWNWSVSNN